MARRLGRFGLEEPPQLIVQSSPLALRTGRQDVAGQMRLTLLPSHLLKLGGQRLDPPFVIDQLPTAPAASER